MTQEQIQAAFNLISQDDTLIHGVLKALNVSHKRSNYDDLYQEGLLAFVDAYQHFPGNPETDHHALMVYCFQAVKWTLLMDFRQTNQYNQHIGFVDQQDDNNNAILDYLDQLSSPITSAESNLLHQECFEQLYQACTPREQRFLVLRYFYNAELKEIATDLNVTRRTANNIKFKIQKKFSAVLIE